MFDQSVTVADFVATARAQPDDAPVELVAGRVMPMGIERPAHRRVRTRTWSALVHAAPSARMTLTVWPAGLLVAASKTHVLRPDVVVTAGTANALAGILADDALLVVEAVEDGPRFGHDHVAKLPAYARLPSLTYYLVPMIGEAAVHLYTRTQEGRFELSFVDSGVLELPALELSVDVEALFDTAAG